MMPPQIKLSYKVHFNSPEFQTLLNKTKKRIKNVLQKYKDSYVAYSGGKDSLTMLHLIKSIKNDIYVYHYDYGIHLLPQEIENEIQDNLVKLGVKKQNLTIKVRPGSQETARNSTTSKSPFFPKLVEFFKENNYKFDLAFIGIRQQESLRRKHIYDKFLNYNNSFRLYECFPLLNWKSKDIWSYLIGNKLSYPSIYDKMAKLYGNYNDLRLATFFDHEFDSLGNFEVSGILFWKYKH